jgi:hypothetical protein
MATRAPATTLSSCGQAIACCVVLVATLSAAAPPDGGRETFPSAAATEPPQPPAPARPERELIRPTASRPAATTRAVPPQPASRTARQVEGWTVRVDDRLLAAAARPDAELGARALRFLEVKLSEIKLVVPPARVAELQQIPIVLDLTCGGLGPMQYHPSAAWLKANGYPAELAKCVHLPRAADVVTRRNVREQPWVILHELAHGYHDRVLGFDDPRVTEAYRRFKESGRGERVLLHDGRRVRHYALTDHKEFFAEMTEAYFGANDFYPFNRAELREAEPDILALMSAIWGG